MKFLEFIGDKHPMGDDLNDLAEDWRRQPCGILTLLGDKVAVEPIEGDTNINGLSIPENAREKPMKGILTALGSDITNKVGAALKIGDIVLFGKHAGVEVTLENKEYKIMREAEIFAII